MIVIMCSYIVRSKGMSTVINAVEVGCIGAKVYTSVVLRYSTTIHFKRINWSPYLSGLVDTDSAIY